MTQLVRQGAHVIVFAKEIHQHIRMHIVSRAVRICPGPLSLIRVHVDPAFRKSLPADGEIFRSKRFKRGQDVPLRLFNGIPEVHMVQQGCVEIMVMEFLETENALAEIQIPVEGGEILVDVVHEVSVDIHGNIAAIKGGMEA